MNLIALTRLRTWMAAQGYERFFVQQPENFAWLTGGGDNTVLTLRPVAAWLEVTPQTVRLHSSRIEARRLREEEVGGLEVVPYPWYAPPKAEGPSDQEHDLTPLRLVLSPEEQDRYRTLGRDAAQALGESLRFADPEWSEFELAGAIAEELWSRGIQPVVLLVAGEERLFRHRHPIPKEARLGRLFMGVVCGRRHGLIANLTRLRSFGHPQAQTLNARVCRVEARALAASRPGASLGEVLAEIQAGYQELGCPEEFENHHQGGLTGYRSREVLAAPGEATRLQVGMALAWNPSLPGAKVEDTFLLGEDGLENLTFDPAWPMEEVEGRLRPRVYEG
ncbi:MAG: M24 family metallopeptidase [Deinococcus-Thermus bacterium]|uniref:M24 family metallopeptidase n=1 Tax=Meiothermus luteus TaxID=2026184 RepID=UPI000E655798|nr:M24 family metallopeptidase [Meiothermus luteus]RMH55014.1 MAG: M24 family metallopeptidase [Deinococcota bacterium]